MNKQAGSKAVSWLFVAGQDRPKLAQAIDARPGVLVVDLEEFTPPGEKDAACRLFAETAEMCRRRAIGCAIRLDRLARGGEAQLAAIAAAAPDAVFLPQIEDARQLIELDELMTRHGLTDGAIVPTIESRQGLSRLASILTATSRVRAALLGSGDLSLDMGIADDPRRMAHLLPLRRRFIERCRRHGAEAIDGPWPKNIGEDGFADDCEQSLRAGYRSRCAIAPEQTRYWQSQNIRTDHTDHNKDYLTPWSK
ncbi:aldolase/citrate lyase family protein [Brenneria tiliae]|uniref:Aldolase/citrate lyase family protein n=1 Tax=Brenneria tiliae TaxID=2914984 RepID=A0ABT0N1Z7_9GAMM|nr:aldolase/citrate lyase family protein [Brenneria tiliae]MCL2895603.1 aldolase/citrate lyase family protein [Brenneria tiliae]